MGIVDQAEKLQSIEGKMFRDTIEKFVATVEKKSPLDIYRFQMACENYSEYCDLFMQDPVNAQEEGRAFLDMNYGHQAVAKAVYRYVVDGLSYKTLSKGLRF